MYVAYGSPNEVATLIASLLNGAAFDVRLQRFPEVDYVVRDGDKVLRHTVHTY